MGNNCLTFHALFPILHLSIFGLIDTERVLYWSEGDGGLKNQDERREDERNELQWPITILTDYANVEGVTINISVDGVYVRCEEPLLLDESYRMSISPPNHDAIEVFGKVVRSEFYGMSEDSSTFGMGVCFVEISEKERNALSAVMLNPTEE